MERLRGGGLMGMRDGGKRHFGSCWMHIRGQMQSWPLQKRSEAEGRGIVYIAALKPLSIRESWICIKAKQHFLNFFLEGELAVLLKLVVAPLLHGFLPLA